MVLFIFPIVTSDIQISDAFLNLSSFPSHTRTHLLVLCVTFAQIMPACLRYMYSRLNKRASAVRLARKPLSDLRISSHWEMNSGAWPLVLINTSRTPHQNGGRIFLTLQARFNGIADRLMQDW